LAGTDEDAAVAGAEGVDVAGAEEILRLGVVGDGDFDGFGAVAGADAGADAEAFVGVDGNGEGGAETGGVDLGLAVEAEAVADFAGEGEAKDAAGFFEGEIDGLGGDFFGRVDEVALVLAVFIVNQDDGFAGAELVENFGDGGKGHRTSMRHCSILIGWGREGSGSGGAFLGENPHPSPLPAYRERGLNVEHRTLNFQRRTNAYLRTAKHVSITQIPIRVEGPRVIRTLAFQKVGADEPNDDVTFQHCFDD
jgi:hypothetical protein